MKIPVIDIAPFLFPSPPDQKQAVIDQWSEAFQRWGFAMIVGHGVSSTLQDEIYNAGLAFFDEPLAEKQRSAFPGPQKSQGYVSQGIESVGKTHGKTAAPPDLVENISFTNVDWEQKTFTNDLDREIFRANLWPQNPPSLPALVREYYGQMQNLAQQLMRLSAASLNLPENFFGPFYDRMAGILRLAHYPAQRDQPLDGQLRYGAHTDYMGLTILRQDVARGGLQVQTPAGDWLDVAPVPGSFVINSGDLIARWTNDRWKSTVHRVTNPPRTGAVSSRRLSIVFFTGPSYDAVCSCLPTCLAAGEAPVYAPIRCFDSLMEKVRSSMPETVQAAG